MNYRLIALLLASASGCAVPLSARVESRLDDHTVELSVPAGVMQSGDRVTVGAVECPGERSVTLRGRAMPVQCKDVLDRQGTVGAVLSPTTVTVIFSEPFPVEAGDSVHIHLRNKQ